MNTIVKKRFIHEYLNSDFGELDLIIFKKIFPNIKEPKMGWSNFQKLIPNYIAGNIRQEKETQYIIDNIVDDKIFNHELEEAKFWFKIFRKNREQKTISNNLSALRREILNQYENINKEYKEEYLYRIAI